MSKNNDLLFGNGITEEAELTAENLSVLIPDGESEFALFVARCLAQVPNLQLHVQSSEPWVPLRFSRHRRTYSFQQWGDDSYQRLDAISRAITRTGADVILPVDEPATQFVSAHRQAIAELAAVPPIPDPDIFETVTNKWLLVDFLKENHIPGPPSILYTADENFEQGLRELQFPVLVKPTRGRGGEGIQFFDGPARLLDFLRDVSKGSSLHYIVQSFVHGYDVDCSVLCKDGKILAYTIQKGFILDAETFTAPAGIDFMQDEQVFDVVSRLVSAAKWSGVAHMDLRYDNLDGRVKLLETNARYWGSLIGSLVMGVNFPYLACLAALNVSFPIPDYRLGRYIAPGSAIKQRLRTFLGRSEVDFTFEETGLRYALADPLAEASKLFRQAVAQNRLKPMH